MKTGDQLHYSTPLARYEHTDINSGIGRTNQAHYKQLFKKNLKIKYRREKVALSA